MGSPLKIFGGGHIAINKPDLPTSRKFIIFREIDYDTAAGKFHFSRKDLRFDIGALPKNLDTIEKILSNINDYNNIGHSQEKKSETSELAISVRDPSYIVLSISNNLPWTFGGDVEGQAVSLGDARGEIYKGNFAKVIHFNSDNTITPEVGTKCRLVAFSVDPLLQPDPHTEPYNDQPINFHLVDTGGTPITVDPDIRYPGNTGYDMDPPPIIIPPLEERQP